MKISNELINIIMGEDLYMINKVQGKETTYTIGQGKIVYQGKEFKINPTKHIFNNWMSNIQTHFTNAFYEDIASTLKGDYVDYKFWKNELYKLYCYYEGHIEMLIDDELVNEEVKRIKEEEEITYQGNYLDQFLLDKAFNNLIEWVIECIGETINRIIED